MADTDKTLGEAVHRRLVELGIETPMKGHASKHDETLLDGTRASHTTIMRCLGLDVDGDDSLRDTPKRVSKMYHEELFCGLNYGNFPKASTFDNKARYDEMLCARNITVHSFCEHHFLPFIGTAHVAYIPGDKILGLSKFNRIVDFFARRPQVQERLTEQISAAFRHILQTEDVAVVIQAEHYCVKLRGVKDGCGDTVTSKLSGRFRSVPELRAEFLALTRN